MDADALPHSLAIGKVRRASETLGFELEPRVLPTLATLTAHTSLYGGGPSPLAETVTRPAACAALGDFMDMPMRTYSPGMYSRLAFSVAVNMDPDILLIDEAMSAGDAKFRKKASNRMMDLAHNNRHSATTYRWAIANS